MRLRHRHQLQQVAVVLVVVIAVVDDDDDDDDGGGGVSDHYYDDDDDDGDDYDDVKIQFVHKSIVDLANLSSKHQNVILVIEQVAIRSKCSTTNMSDICCFRTSAMSVITPWYKLRVFTLIFALLGLPTCVHGFAVWLCFDTQTLISQRTERRPDKITSEVWYTPRLN